MLIRNWFSDTGDSGLISERMFDYYVSVACYANPGRAQWGTLKGSPAGILWLQLWPHEFPEAKDKISEIEAHISLSPYGSGPEIGNPKILGAYPRCIRRSKEVFSTSAEEPIDFDHRHHDKILWDRSSRWRFSAALEADENGQPSKVRWSLLGDGHASADDAWERLMLPIVIEHPTPTFTVKVQFPKFKMKGKWEKLKAWIHGRGFYLCEWLHVTLSQGEGEEAVLDEVVDLIQRAPRSWDSRDVLRPEDMKALCPDDDIQDVQPPADSMWALSERSRRDYA